MGRTTSITLRPSSARWVPRNRPLPGERGTRRVPPSVPSGLYLHYLLLHIDRLNDSALRYLKQAVDEEMAHRQG